MRGRLSGTKARGASVSVRNDVRAFPKARPFGWNDARVLASSDIIVPKHYQSVDGVNWATRAYPTYTRGETAGAVGRGKPVGC